MLGTVAAGTTGKAGDAAEDDPVLGLAETASKAAGKEGAAKTNAAVGTAARAGKDGDAVKDVEDGDAAADLRSSEWRLDRDTGE